MAISDVWWGKLLFFFILALLVATILFACLREDPWQVVERVDVPDPGRTVFILFLLTAMWVGAWALHVIRLIIEIEKELAL